MIRRTGSYAVGIGYKQRVGSIGQAAHAAEHGIARIGILAGERGLPDDQPRCLSGGKPGGLAVDRGRANNEHRNALHAFMKTRQMRL